MGQTHPYVQIADRPVRHAPDSDRVPLHLTARRVTVAATLACALMLGVFVLRDHFIGGEVWGPVAAVLGIAAGALALATGRRPRRRGILAVIVLLWLIVALLGVGGTLDHASPVLPEYLDQRWRPPFVPLTSTVVAGVAILAAVWESRVNARAGSHDGEG